MENLKNNYLSNSQINFLTYLISLVPAALIIGSFIVDLIVTFCAFTFLYIFKKEKINIIFNNWLIKILIIFYIYLISKSLINNEEIHSISRSLFYIRYILFSLLICYIYNINSNFKKIFFRFLTITFIILSIHAYLLHFLNFDFLNINFNKISLDQNFSQIYNKYKVPIDYRVSGLFYSESILGSYTQKLLPIYFGFFFLNNKSKKYFFLGLIFFFLIIISGERSSIALSFLFLITFFLTLKSKTIHKLYLILFFIVIFIFIYSNPNLKHRIIDNTFKSITEKKVQMNYNENKKELDGDNKFDINIFSLGHQGHFESAYKIFLDNPILGIGIKDFRYECKKPEYYDVYACTTHPHNTYMQLLAETGIIGFSLVFIIFFVLSYKIFKLIFFNKIKIKYTTYYKCFLICVFMNLWPLIPTGSFFNNWLSIIYFLSIGFYLGELYKEKNRRS